MVTIQDAKEATLSIIKTLHPLSVILFGSVARNGIGADMDLLIVTDHKADKFGDPNILIHKCLKKFYKRFAIDPFVVPVSLLNNYYSAGSPFLKMISEEGKMMYMKNAVKEWKKQSGDEIRMAEYLLQGQFFKGTCYHAQQSVEKSIKARLLGKGWLLEKTHNIERLVAIARDYKIRFKLTGEEITFMDNIYRGRYPVEAGLLPLGELSESDADKALKIAKRLFTNLKSGT